MAGSLQRYVPIFASPPHPRAVAAKRLFYPILHVLCVVVLREPGVYLLPLFSWLPPRLLQLLFPGVAVPLQKDALLMQRYFTRKYGKRDKNAPASRLASSSSLSRLFRSWSSLRRRSSSRACLTAALLFAFASRSFSEATLCFSAYSWPLLSSTSFLVFLKSPNIRERRALVSRLSWCCCLELSMRDLWRASKVKRSFSCCAS